MSFRGAIAGFADDHDDVEQRLSNNDWYVYNFHSHFCCWCVFQEKRDLSQLNTQDSDSYIMNSHAVSHSHRAGISQPGPGPCAAVSGVEGLTCVSVEAADHQC